MNFFGDAALKNEIKEQKELLENFKQQNATLKAVASQNQLEIEKANLTVETLRNNLEKEKQQSAHWKNKAFSSIGKKLWNSIV